LLHLKFSGNGWRELFRYSLFSLIPTGVDITIIYLLHYLLDWPWALAVAIAFILGASVSYFLSITLVFKNYIRQKMRREYPTFIIICTCGFVFNQIIVIGLYSLAWLSQDPNINLWAAKALSVIVVGLFQFLAKKHYLFNNVGKNVKY